jgi:hypothetical protein
MRFVFIRIVVIFRWKVLIKSGEWTLLDESWRRIQAWRRNMDIRNVRNIRESGRKSWCFF